MTSSFTAASIIEQPSVKKRCGTLIRVEMIFTYLCIYLNLLKNEIMIVKLCARDTSSSRQVSISCGGLGRLFRRQINECADGRLGLGRCIGQDVIWDQGVWTSQLPEAFTFRQVA